MYDDYLYLQKDPVQKIEDKPNQLKVEQKEAAKKFYELERNIKKAEDKLKNLELTLTEYEYGNPMFAQVSKKIVNQKKEIDPIEMPDDSAIQSFQNETNNETKTTNDKSMIAQEF